MGRVSRYKKVKAIDPFAKRKQAEQRDTTHDMPPEEHELRANHVSRKRRRLWEQEALGNDEYVQHLDDPSSRPKLSEKIEGKRKGESMREFRQRLRNQTKNFLIQDAKQSSTTSQKRKLYLDAKKRRKKEKKDSFENKHLVLELGGTSEFAVPEPVVFGETVDRPPDLREVQPKLKGKVPTRGSACRFEGVSKASDNSQLSQLRQMEELKDQLTQRYKLIKARRRELNPNEIVL